MLCRSVHERGCPITLLNVGPTRADDLATLKIEARCGEVRIWGVRVECGMWHVV